MDQSETIMALITAFSRAGLGAVFIVAGHKKLSNRAQFAQTIANHGLLPATLRWPLAAYLGHVEIALGILLIAGLMTTIVSALAISFLALFTVYMALAITYGVKDTCGCIGQSHIGQSAILRNALLLLMATVTLASQERMLEMDGLLNSTSGFIPLSWIGAVVVVTFAFSSAEVIGLIYAPKYQTR
jgi:uncharacterized membrane protein YphA (DoxX/SURF4 family)